MKTQSPSRPSVPSAAENEILNALVGRVRYPSFVGGLSSVGNGDMLGQFASRQASHQSRDANVVD